jgi:hypothetical protein
VLCAEFRLVGTVEVLFTDSALVTAPSAMEEGAGPCATEPCEPRQIRKEATVSGQFCVPQDHLAPLFSCEKS